MNKLSSEKVAGVLGQVGPVLRALSEENQALKEKVAHYQKRDRVEKLASVMEQKHLDPETSYEDKVESLMAADDLGVYEKAVELSAPQIKLAHLSDDPGNSSDAATSFESAVVSD